MLTPVLANVETATAAQTVNAAATAITSTLTITGNPSTQLFGAIVQLDSNNSPTEDVLIYPAKIGNITGSFDASTGKITLSGADSAANYQAALRSVTYQDTSSNPSTLIRRFQITASDAVGQSLPVYRYLNIVSMISNVSSKNSTYTEGDLATVVASQLNLSATASGTIKSASVRIDANYVLGEDVLGFDNSTASSSATPVGRPNAAGVTPTISGNWNPSTGTITLTAALGQTPTLADFQAALRSVTYMNTSQDPSTPVRRFAIWTNDGDSPVLDVYSYFNVIAVNTPPTIVAPNALSTVEQTPLVINGITFADVDAGSGFETVTLSVSHGVLSLGRLLPAGLPAGSIVGNNSASLTLNGPIAKLNAIVLGLNYYPLPYFHGADTLAIQINDNGNTGIGGSMTASANVGITVAPLNQPPKIVSPGSVAAAENTTAVVNGISFSDSDAGSANETVTLSVKQGTLTISSNVAGGLIAAQITGSGTQTIIINGPLAAINATLADKAGLIYLSNLNFYGSDSISITINDQGNSGAGGPMIALASISISVAHVNQRPVVSNLESVAYAYKEKDFATPISNQVVVSDVDHATLTSGKVSIDANYTASEDVLNFIPSAATGNIAVVSNAGGVLNLASVGATATTANWQAALRAVTYKNTSSDPNTAVRRFLFQVNDGSLYSLQQYRWFTVTAVNDPPTITAPASATTSVNTTLAVGGISFADPDARSSSETLVLLCLNGVLTVDTGVTGGLTASQISGNGTATISITASLSALNATLANVRGLTYQPKSNFVGSDVLFLNLTDNGNTGSGGPLGAVASIRLSVIG